MLKGAQRPVLVFLGSRCLMPKFSVYAVARGRSVGLFHDWSGAQTSVHGFSGAVFKGFHSVPDAEDCALLFVCVVSCCVSWAAATVCFCFRFLPVFSVQVCMVVVRDCGLDACCMQAALVGLCLCVVKVCLPAAIVCSFSCLTSAFPPFA